MAIRLNINNIGFQNNFEIPATSAASRHPWMNGITKDNICDDIVANGQKDQTNSMKPSIAEFCYHQMNLTTIISMHSAFGNFVDLV